MRHVDVSSRLPSRHDHLRKQQMQVLSLFCRAFTREVQWPCVAAYNLRSSYPRKFTPCVKASLNVAAAVGSFVCPVRQHFLSIQSRSYFCELAQRYHRRLIKCSTHKQTPASLSGNKQHIRKLFLKEIEGKCVIQTRLHRFVLCVQSPSGTVLLSPTKPWTPHKLGPWFGIQLDITSKYVNYLTGQRKLRQVR